MAHEEKLSLLHLTVGFVFIKPFIIKKKQIQDIDSNHIVKL